VVVARIAGSNAPDTRARILESAVTLFAEGGFAGTTIRDLAERAGMTTAAMYYHFASKDQILDALFAPCLDGLRDISTESGGDQQRDLLEKLIDLFTNQGASIQVVMNDRSAMRHVLADTDFPDVMGAVTRLLADSDEPADLLRARCALGALQRGLAPPPGQSTPVSAPTETANTGEGAVRNSVDSAARSIIVAAALAALNSRPPA
jgi:AcrR family transcriptional regulator